MSHFILGNPCGERICPMCNGHGEIPGLPKPPVQIIGNEPILPYIFCENCLGTGKLVLRHVMYSDKDCTDLAILYAELGLIGVKVIEVPG